MPPSAPQRPPQQGVRRLHPPPISTVVQRVRRQQSAHGEGGGKAIQDRAIGLRGVQTLGGSDPFSPTIALEPAPALSHSPRMNVTAPSVRSYATPRLETLWRRRHPAAPDLSTTRRASRFRRPLGHSYPHRRPASVPPGADRP